MKPARNRIVLLAVAMAPPLMPAVVAAQTRDNATQRLLQNQTDIGNAIAPYYGKDAGDKLTSLLKEHILIAADLVGAAKAGDKVKSDSLNKKWRANAEDIANFLHSANAQHWPAATLRTAMFTHLDHTLSEATHRLKGDCAADVKDYDAIEQHILTMADMLSDGIIAQFPQKFGAAKKSASR
jgi:hypothetical protein